MAKADLVKTVDETKDLTVFVPSNDAFAAIASIAANASVETIATVLKYHVIAGSVLYSTDLKNTTVKTLGGGSITVTVANGSVFVNQAKVIIPNVLVANGVVHVIDSVLNPGNTTVAPGTNGTVFPGASSASDVPFTSGVPSATLSGSDVPTAVASPSASIKPSSAGAPGAAYAMATGIVGAGVVFAGALMAL